MSEAPKVIILRPGEGRSIDLGAFTMSVKATSDETGGAFSLLEAGEPAGFGPPLHVHHGIGEAFYVLEGEYIIFIEDLAFARERGLWLIDFAVEPVNHLPTQLRRSIVRDGIPRVARAIRDSQSAFVATIGTTYVAGPGRTALHPSGSDAELVELPFPSRQWRGGFVSGLGTLLRRARRLPTSVPASSSSASPRQHRLLLVST